MGMLRAMSDPGRPRVAVFGARDPADKRTWSGTPFHALQALKRHHDVVFVEHRPLPRLFASLDKAVLRLSGGRIALHLVGPLVRLLSAPARRRIAASGADVALSFAGSALSRFLPPDLPHVALSDATSTAIIPYYDAFDAMLPVFKRHFIANETDAMEKSAVLAYPSHWAANSAVRDHGIDPAKVVVIPWGPNRENVAPGQPRTLNSAYPVRLLFIGLDWERKGGPVALETMRLLGRRGVSCTLDIVGVDQAVAAGPVPSNVTFHGRLYKDNPGEAKRLADLLARADIFFTPTRAEALGIVFAEAAQQGQPSISYRTGGVPGVVRDGKTGVLLDPEAGAEAFADVIAALVADPERYAAMSRAALAFARDHLDWDRWAAAMVPVVAAARDGHPPPGSLADEVRLSSD